MIICDKCKQHKRSIRTYYFGTLSEKPLFHYDLCEDCVKEIKNINTYSQKVDNHYNFKSVKIGNQVWMAKNLTIDDGCKGICKKDGQTYYTWEAAMRVAKQIPGWHLPTKEEFETLIKNAGGIKIAGKMLKSTEGWESWIKDGNGTNKFGFNAKPCSFISNNGYGPYIGLSTSFWSSTKYDKKNVYSMYFNNDDDEAYLEYDASSDEDFGFSVRLIKD